MEEGDTTTLNNLFCENVIEDPVIQSKEDDSIIADDILDIVPVSAPEESTVVEVTEKRFLDRVVNLASYVFVEVLTPLYQITGGILGNTTLWMVIRSVTEVCLEMLLYIILAMCYVFIKFITQVENKRDRLRMERKSEEECELNVVDASSKVECANSLNERYSSEMRQEE